MYMFYDLFRREPNVMTIPEREYLFQEGEGNDGQMFVLVAGQANVLVGGVLAEVATAGTILGEMALIERREPRSASVQAVTPCEFVVINEKRFHYLVTEVPQFAIQVMRVLAYRLRRANEVITWQDSRGRMHEESATPDA